jgi:hypothetical protein
MKIDTDPIPPTTWLWQEIERRFGREVAAELREGFNARMKAYERERRIEQYREELALYELRLQEAKREGKVTKNLINKIAHRRKRITEGWPEEIEK